MSRPRINRLAPRTLVLGYASGAFPMPDPEEESEILWFSPSPRGLLPLDGSFHVARRLARTIGRRRFVCTIERDFTGVMRGCGRRPEGTWITREFLDAYGRLHELGLAHSVEAWRAGAEGGPNFATGLAGGVYGVALGAAFFAESMFHRDTDAGKVALAHLVGHLRARGFLLCDVQWLTPHLAQFGGFELDRLEYLSLLIAALARPAVFP